MMQFSSLTLYRRLVKTYVLHYRQALVIAGLAMAMVAASNAGIAYILQPVLDQIFVTKNAELLLVLPAIIVGLSLVNALGDYGQALALKYVGQRVVADMQGDLFAHLMNADISLFHDQASGRLISRLSNDIQLMRQSVSQVLTGLIKDSLTLVFLLGVMLHQNWELSVVALIVLVFAVLPVVRLGKRMRKIADATQSQLADFTAQLDDVFQGVRVVKAYTREAYEAERVRGTIRQLFKLYYKASRVQSAAGPIMALLGGIAVAAVIAYGGMRVVEGETTAGAFISFIAAMVMAYRPAKVIASLNTQLQEGMAAAGRFFAVLDTEPNIKDAPGSAPLVITRGAVRFDAVSFRYHAEGGGVDDISFEASAGKTLALVGASGSGKTTLFNLLLRFYDVQQGSITIDGQDIASVTLASLRNSIALVSQEVVLFDETVRANIAYGKLDASEQEIIDAAKAANAHEFIERLPQGYDTPIGPHGVKLSGGQRQRLSIARAILKNAKILLLDEATSALDSASEHAVQEALERLMVGRTTLVIAHRLSTIQSADTILVLHRGRIEARGTHAELLASSSLYRQLHRLDETP